MVELLSDTTILNETAAEISRILGQDAERITIERVVIGLFFTGVKLSTGVAGDLSPFFPPIKNRVLSCRHADRDGVSLFGRVSFLRPGHLRQGCRAQPGSRLAAGHRRRRRAAGLTQASTAAA